jgi:hypothetical protein
MSSETDPRSTRAALLQAFVQPFRARGGDIGEILRRNHLPPEVLSDPDRPIEASTCYAAMEDMAAALGDLYFCANVARAAARSGVPMLRNSAAQAASLGDFLTSAILETGRRFDNVAYTLHVAQEAAVVSIRRTRRIKRPTISSGLPRR